MTMPLSPGRRRTALTTVMVSAALMATALASSAGATTPDDTGSTAGDTTGESPSDAGDTRIVEADNGSIEVPADPQRVATLGRSTASFLDLGGEPVGVTELGADDLAALAEDQQAAYAAATLLGSGASEADLELLATLEPDLIVMSAPDADYEQMKGQLQAIAPTVFLGFDTDWEVRLDVLAAASNRTDVLDEQRAAYEERVARIRETYADVIETTTFAEVSRGEFLDPGLFVLNGSLCSEVARADLGLDIADLGDGGEERSFEQLGELADYDVLIFPVDHDGNVPDDFAPVTETNAWNALEAVTSGRAVGVYCPWSRSYDFSSQYMDSLDAALASLPAQD